MPSLRAVLAARERKICQGPAAVSIEEEEESGIQLLDWE